MRGFIQFCGGLFVVLGMIIVAIGALALLLSPRAGNFGAAIGITSVLAAAGVTLIGGTAYMLCSIDKRLESLASNPSAVKVQAKSEDLAF